MKWLDSFKAELPASVVAMLVERALPRGQFLFLRGEPPQSMYCVLSGEIRLTRTLPSGSEVVLQRAMQGFIAEASLDQPKYHCDAIAALPTRVLAIPRRGFRQALETPGFRDFWIRTLSSELRRVRTQNERLGLKTARERILHFIEAEGRDGVLILTQSRKAWAAQLGLTHEALYRTLQDMSKNGDLILDAETLQVPILTQRVNIIYVYSQKF